MCDNELKIVTKTKIDRLIDAIEALNKTLGGKNESPVTIVSYWDKVKDYRDFMGSQSGIGRKYTKEAEITAKISRLKAELAEAEKALK